jgi:dipeptidyl aminopeptidase/acylaminoacyl peptidase
MTRRGLFITALGALAATCVLPGPTPAELPPLIPREILFDNPPRTGAAISPDGTLLGFIAPSAAGVSNIWVEPLAGGEAVMVTDDARRGIYGFHWAPDGEHLLFVQDRDGDENWHLYAARLATREVRDLTPYEGIAADNILTDRDHPGTVLVGLNRRDPRTHDMYRIDIASGEAVLETENPGDVVEWAVDNDFRIRAAVALDPETSDTIIRVRDDADGPWRELARWPFLETGSVLYKKILGYAPGGEGIYVQYPLGSDKTRLVVLDAETGEVAREIAADPRCDLWNVWWTPQVVINPRTHVVEAVGFSYLKPEWRVIDPEVAADFERLARSGSGVFKITSRDAADRRWIVEYGSDVQAGRAHLYDRDAGTLTFLYADIPALADHVLAPQLPVMIPARDGLLLPSLLTLPVGVPPRDLPLVLLPHGGPWVQDEWGYHPWCQLLANRGYAVLQPNFRGSTGWGKAFLNAANREWAGKMLDDLTDAVGWAVAAGVADPRRVAIMGGSYGGYATLCGITFTPELYACAVAMVAPSNVQTLFESFPPYWQARMKRWALRVGPAATDDAFNERISPLFHAERIRVPLLVGHGANDVRVKQSEADAIVAAARRNGVDVAYIVYPDEGHGWARPENNKDWMGRVEEFLAAHLGGRREPWVAVPGASAEIR